MVAKYTVLEWAVTEILEEKIANSYQIQLFERQIRHGKMAQKNPHSMYKKSPEIISLEYGKKSKTDQRSSK